MWLINWIPGLLFIRFTDALCTRFVGDTVLRGANPVAKVNSLCSWSRHKQRGAEWKGERKPCFARPRSKARLTSGGPRPHSAVSVQVDLCWKGSLFRAEHEEGVLIWGCFSEGTERCRQTPRVTLGSTQGSAEPECVRLGTTPVKL